MGRDVNGQDDSENEALDDTDLAILADLRDLHAIEDPPPPDLDTRVLFALALRDLEDEVARLREETLAGSGPRGALRTRTLAFESAGLELVISVTATGSGGVRVDGWLVPPAPRSVQLRLEGDEPGQVGATRTAQADSAGRFVIGNVRGGLAQLRVLPRSGASGVVTSSFVL